MEQAQTDDKCRKYFCKLGWDEKYFSPCNEGDGNFIRKIRGVKYMY